MESASAIDIERRNFVQCSSAVCIGVASSGSMLGAVAKQRVALPDWAAKDPWLTLASVQEHLFPASEHGPGALEIQAIQYLYNELRILRIDDEQRRFIINGVGWLNDIAKEAKQLSFYQLQSEDKEVVLRKIEQSRAGRRWISRMLTFVLEALLADPVYGGNPAGIGWHWLRHKPGFPRPDMRHRWHQLAYTQRANLKAGGG